jgi:ATP-binding cassette subfamily F protein 3
MQSIDALADAIEAFAGSTIMVTHSEMLLHRLADALIIFHKGGAEYFDGTYSDFLEKIGWEEEEGNVKPKKKKSKLHHKERKKLRKALMTERSAERKPHTHEITVCETRIEKLEDQMALKNEALTEASNSGDNDAIMEISREVGLLQQEIDALFERLEIATELDEEIVARYEVKLEEIDA